MATLPAMSMNKGAPAPAAYLSGDGAIFWGVQQTTAQGYGYAVYRQTSAGIMLAAFYPGGQGQLCLQPSGALWAVFHAATGDGKGVEARTVPGWVAFAPTASGGLSERYHAALERLCAFLGV